MDDFVLQKLQATGDPAEKAAIIAEFILDQLPEEVARVARYCVILHWFDQSIVESLLQDTPLTQAEIEEVYNQVRSLPFIETLNWGLTIQDLTREGLLHLYIETRPELLRTAAKLAAPA